MEIGRVWGLDVLIRVEKVVDNRTWRSVFFYHIIMKSIMLSPILLMLAIYKRKFFYETYRRFKSTKFMVNPIKQAEVEISLSNEQMKADLLKKLKMHKVDEEIKWN